jgi:hypothetical protein
MQRFFVLDLWLSRLHSISLVAGYALNALTVFVSTAAVPSDDIGLGASVIRKIDATGKITTVAGSGNNQLDFGCADGSLATDCDMYCRWIDVDDAGNIYASVHGR